MPNKHLLSLDIPDSNNPYIISVNDNSVYAESLRVSCGELFVTVPGFTTPVKIDTTVNFKLNLTACALGIQLKNCDDTFEVLPDGIYVIRYMVAPFSQVYVEYNFLRLTNINNHYYKYLSNLELAMSDPGNDTKNLLAELRLIRSFLDAAKSKVEISHQSKDGADLLIYAKKRLNKLTEHCN
jgi:hypothetical protein